MGAGPNEVPFDLERMHFRTIPQLPMSYKYTPMT